MNKTWFTVVEYLRCPNCKMVFDPKGLHVEDGDGEDYDETDEVLTCRFCGHKAGIDFAEKECRI